MLLADAIALHAAVTSDWETADGLSAPTMTVAGVTVDTANVATWLAELATCIADAQSAGVDNVNTLRCATALTSEQRLAIKAVNYAAAHS